MTTDHERRQLVVDSRAVLEYTRFAQAQPTVEEARALAPLDVVVPAVIRQLAGHWFVTEDDGLTDALLDRGAVVIRHAHVYRLDLRIPSTSASATPVGSSLRVGPIVRPVAELVDVALRAYPEDHPDFETASPAEVRIELAQLLAGEMIGPLLDAASGQVVVDDRVVAACIINRMPDVGAFAGGPWVSEIFRDPSAGARGLGAVLLRRAVAALVGEGEESLGLVVTDGNPAEALYRRMGFERVSSRRKILIPPST